MDHVPSYQLNNPSKSLEIKVYNGDVLENRLCVFFWMGWFIDVFATFFVYIYNQFIQCGYLTSTAVIATVDDLCLEMTTWLIYYVVWPNFALKNLENDHMPWMYVKVVFVFLPIGSMVLVYLPTWLDDFVRANVGVHVPAP